MIWFFPFYLFQITVVNTCTRILVVKMNKGHRQMLTVSFDTNILLGVLVCSIAEYFYEVCCILTGQQWSAYQKNNDKKSAKDSKGKNRSMLHLTTRSPSQSESLWVSCYNCCDKMDCVHFDSYPWVYRVKKKMKI